MHKYMRVAIIGSRSLNIEIDKFIPIGAALIISGGARGIDMLAEKYAEKKNLSRLIFLPDYEQYGNIAPLIRNKLIVDSADLIVAIWDGKSRGTQHAINYAHTVGKKVVVHIIPHN